MKTRFGWKHPAVLLGAVTLAGGFVWFATSDEKPAAVVQAKSVESNPWAPERFKSADAAASASAASAVAPALASSNPIARAARIDGMLSSTSAVDRMLAAKELHDCAAAQVNLPRLAKSLPSDASQMFADINAICDGLSADLLAKRRVVIEELAKDGHPGAAVMFIANAPDGTDLSVAMKDPNHSQWYGKALGYLESAARGGDLDSISAARTLSAQDPARAYDAVVYRIAELQASSVMFPSTSPAQIAQMIERETKILGKSLSDEQIKKAKVEGLALAKTVKQQKGN